MTTGSTDSPAAPPTFEAIDLSVEAHVATAVLRAPKGAKASRMGPAFWREMPEAFAWLDASPDVRAVVLRGEGEHFSHGLDLATMGGELAAVIADGSMAKERTVLLATIERLQRAVTCVAACRKPVIAAISGWCIGGGVDLATACDVRLASEDARFSVREIKLAMVADIGTLARLPAIVGQGHARLLALTGDDIDAARALRIGLVEDVYATPALMFDAARALAARIAANPPLVAEGVKQVLNAASERAAADSLRTVALWNAAFLPSHDLREAMTAFMTKRAPSFEGR
jgi:enoyl-CoA hydratase